MTDKTTEAFLEAIAGITYILEEIHEEQNTDCPCCGYQRYPFADRAQGILADLYL